MDGGPGTTLAFLADSVANCSTFNFVHLLRRTPLKKGEWDWTKSGNPLGFNFSFVEPTSNFGCFLLSICNNCALKGTVVFGFLLTETASQIDGRRHLCQFKWG